MNTRKLLSSLMTLCLLWLVSMAAHGQTINSGGIFYNILDSNAGTVEVVKSLTDDGYSGDVVIPETVTYGSDEYTVVGIAAEAFYKSRITSISIPPTLTYIGTYAFYECTVLEKVIAKDLTAWFNISFADQFAQPLNYAPNFYSDENTMITDLVIPEGVTEIPDYALCQCLYLESVTLPNSLETIGNTAFYRCQGLTSVVIPDNVTTISANAFNSCSGLRSVTIGRGVETIGGLAFYCQNLQEVICLRETPATVESHSFQNVPSTCTLYVPTGCTAAYSGASTWKNFVIMEIDGKEAKDKALEALDEVMGAIDKYSNHVNSEEWFKAEMSVEDSRTKAENIFHDLIMLTDKMTEKEKNLYSDKVDELMEKAQALREETNGVTSSLERYKIEEEQFVNKWAQYRNLINAATSVDDLNELTEEVNELKNTVESQTINLNYIIIGIGQTLADINTRLDDLEKQFTECSDMINVSVKKTELAALIEATRQSYEQDYPDNFNEERYQQAIEAQETNRTKVGEQRNSLTALEQTVSDAALTDDVKERYTSALGDLMQQTEQLSQENEAVLDGQQTKKQAFVEGLENCKEKLDGYAESTESATTMEELEAIAAKIAQDQSDVKELYRQVTVEYANLENTKSTLADIATELEEVGTHIGQLAEQLTADIEACAQSVAEKKVEVEGMIEATRQSYEEEYADGFDKEHYQQTENAVMENRDAADTRFAEMDELVSTIQSSLLTDEEKAAYTAEVEKLRETAKELLTKNNNALYELDTKKYELKARLKDCKSMLKEYEEETERATTLGELEAIAAKIAQDKNDVAELYQQVKAEYDNLDETDRMLSDIASELKELGEQIAALADEVASSSDANDKAVAEKKAEAQAALDDAQATYEKYAGYLTGNIYQLAVKTQTVNQIVAEGLIADVATLKGKMTQAEAEQYGETLDEVADAAASWQTKNEMTFTFTQFDDTKQDIKAELDAIDIDAATTVSEVNALISRISTIVPTIRLSQADLLEALDDMAGHYLTVSNALDELKATLDECIEGIAGAPESLKVNVGANGLATYCPEYGVDFNGATKIAAYKAAVSDNRVSLTRVDTVAAGEGVLLRSLSGGAAEEELPTAADAVKAADNAFVGTLKAISPLPKQEGNATNFVLAERNGLVGFYTSTQMSIEAGKAYLPVENYNATRSLTITFSDTTGIIEIAPDQADGDDAIYTLGGVRVKTPAKGIYIKNGKKVVFK